MDFLCCVCGIEKEEKVKLEEHIRREHSDKRIVSCKECNKEFELTGQSFLAVTDEVTEAVHSALRLHDEAHGYTINMKGSTIHMMKQHKSTVSFNSRNLGDF